MNFFTGINGGTPRSASEKCGLCGCLAVYHQRDQDRDRFVCPPEQVRGNIVGAGLVRGDRLRNALAVNERFFGGRGVPLGGRGIDSPLVAQNEYQPSEPQRAFLDDPARRKFFGGRRGGKVNAITARMLGKNLTADEKRELDRNARVEAREQVKRASLRREQEERRLQLEAAQTNARTRATAMFVGEDAYMGVPGQPVFYAAQQRAEQPRAKQEPAQPTVKIAPARQYFED